MTKDTPIVIFTGGHHTSGLEVAQNLQKSNITIYWFGHRHSSWGDSRDSAEYREVTASNINFIDLKAGKFHRTYHPLKLLRIPWGFIQAFMQIIILKIKYGRRVTGIVSFGGYLAVPVVISGWILGLKSLTHEQTMVSGWANKIISYFCSKIAISWPQSKTYLPAQKCVLVGLPLRQQILNLPRKTIHKKGLRQIYITGGKQGSHAINLAVFAALNQLLPFYNIVHQTGNTSIYQDYSKAQSILANLPEKLRNNYFPVEYLDGQKAAHTLSDSQTIVTRAGAHIVAELLYFQKKCVLIPLPHGSHHEQDKNAEYLVNQKQAILLPQSQLGSASLINAIKSAEMLTPITNNLNFDGLAALTLLIKKELLNEK